MAVHACHLPLTGFPSAIQLNEDLQFTPMIFGLGSGIFFLGYAFLQVRSAIFSPCPAV